MNVIQALYQGGLPINGTQYKIILCIYDNTDFGKKIGAELSVKDISRDISADERTVKREIKRLIHEGIINVIEEATFEWCRVLAINPLTKWRGLKKGMI